MLTFFDSMNKSFVDVKVEEGKIATGDFLLASELLVKLFDLLGLAAFSIVQSDMTGNITKIRTKLEADPTGASTLQDLVLSEVGAKKRDATQGLLWLLRGLEFTAAALQETILNPDKELASAFTTAYSSTLLQYHGMLVKPVFKLAMKACPYRKDFFAKLGEDQAKVTAQLAEWLAALQAIVKTIVEFFASGNYGKGL